jgi:hypothetical protein
MTVDVALRQPGLPYGTGRPGAATAFAAIHSCPQASARHRARTSSPSSTISSPNDLGCQQHRRRDLNAHAGKTTDGGDYPGAQRISESLLPGRTQPGVRVPNADSLCRLVMR